ncbi:hypothetical protein COX95_04155 [bacterium CG_4_10_14_0_2_um_filter_33_32]|nr:MAG: hypothetical protein AUJ93_01450 [bacterium CG2_30_33_46]PIR67498.1 MAG: hypothetical protein COU50_03080 [bacterium CG10_big_fil_rev_8_21_14_0_10_33_18]PIU77016.1 MAG: hypothetical protein COS74_01140 [bacterium CG06_land_8_20_14_3_00_33_50]PIW81747.1 MAG: hypothetical protein COZ97_00045 [bacterium CG_4_8_14_3_um_filter_33_28]PIY85827.1 MAG: hypothetical protein COY76_00020 [bacterium CG_4_10_14_0_8_um_filter_33_57]PIZ85462.1 MAG: hypothetical protein COX95_04155 [bacterium CG_4_10_1
MEKSKKPKTAISEGDLSWNLADYNKRKEDPPARIKKNPLKTEGELMTDEEMENWFLQSVQTLKVIKEENGEIFMRLHEGFISDLEYLLRLGKIEKDVVEFGKELTNFDF